MPRARNPRCRRWSRYPRPESRSPGWPAIASTTEGRYFSSRSLPFQLGITTEAEHRGIEADRSSEQALPPLDGEIGSAWRFVSGHGFSRAEECSESWALAPAAPSSARGLKPAVWSVSAARLKPCPDTKLDESGPTPGPRGSPTRLLGRTTRQIHHARSPSFSASATPASRNGRSSSAASVRAARFSPAISDQPLQARPAKHPVPARGADLLQLRVYLSQLLIERARPGSALLQFRFQLV